MKPRFATPDLDSSSRESNLSAIQNEPIHDTLRVPRPLKNKLAIPAAFAAAKSRLAEVNFDALKRDGNSTSAEQQPFKQYTGSSVMPSKKKLAIPAAFAISACDSEKIEVSRSAPIKPSTKKLAVPAAFAASNSGPQTVSLKEGDRLAVLARDPAPSVVGMPKIPIPSKVVAVPAALSAAGSAATVSDNSSAVDDGAERSCPEESVVNVAIAEKNEVMTPATEIATAPGETPQDTAPAVVEPVKPLRKLKIPAAFAGGGATPAKPETVAPVPRRKTLKIPSAFGS